jgi:hypothetical protein
LRATQFTSYLVQPSRSLETLLKEICSLDPALGEAFQRYYDVLVEAVPKPYYVVKTYSFGQAMFVEGKPQTSEDKPTTSEEKPPASDDEPPTSAPAQGAPSTSTFPLGIILKGYVEITDYTHGAGPPRQPAPHAVLKPGEFIGIFEFMDWITGGAAGGVPDWTITAGAANIRCPFNTSNKTFARHLRGKFGSQEVNEHTIKNENSFLKQLMAVPSIKSEFDNWTTEVMYFGDDWVRPLLKVDENDLIRSAALELRRIMGERAWRASSRIRPSASNIAPFFFGGPENKGAKISRPELHERQRAIHVFTSLYDLYSGRRPMFIPETKDEKDKWGPMGYICTIVLKGYKKEERPFVLRPEYLNKTLPNAVAFMPVENIASALVEGSGAHAGALMDTLNVIDAAARFDEKMGSHTVVKEFKRMIESLSVRLPAGKEGSRAQSTSIITRKVTRNQHKGVRFAVIDESAFFEPYDIKLDKPGAEFFKTCIRFQIAPP